MAASVRIEDEAFADVSYELLAKAAGLTDADHARGKMARVWRQCTQQRTHILPADVVDVIIGNGGAAAVVTSGLGEKHQRGIRIKGTKGRIEWLDDLRKSAQAGGKARAAAAKRTGGKFTSRVAGERLASDTSGPPAETSAPAPAPAPAPAQIRNPEVGDVVVSEPGAGAAAPGASPRPPRSRKPKAPDLSPELASQVDGLLDKLGRESGIAYRGSDGHKRLIAARLRDGVDEFDLRKVIVYCAHPLGLGWKDDPKMAKFLRPETLFGPQTIDRYLDAARAWYERHVEPEPKSAPQHRQEVSR